MNHSPSSSAISLRNWTDHFINKILFPLHHFPGPAPFIIVKAPTCKRGDASEIRERFKPHGRFRGSGSQGEACGACGEAVAAVFQGPFGRQSLTLRVDDGVVISSIYQVHLDVMIFQKTHPIASAAFPQPYYSWCFDSRSCLVSLSASG